MKPSGTHENIKSNFCYLVKRCVLHDTASIRNTAIAAKNQKTFIGKLDFIDKRKNRVGRTHPAILIDRQSKDLFLSFTKEIRRECLICRNLSCILKIVVKHILEELCVSIKSTH